MTLEIAVALEAAIAALSLNNRNWPRSAGTLGIVPRLENNADGRSAGGRRHVAVRPAGRSRIGRLIAERGKPRMIVSDNGSEFTGNAILGGPTRPASSGTTLPPASRCKTASSRAATAAGVTNCSMRRATCLRSSVFRLLRVTFLVTTARMPELLGGNPWTSLRQRENAGHIPLLAWLHTIYSIKSIGFSFG